MKFASITFALLLALLIVPATFAQQAKQGTSWSDVKTIFETRCLKCHAGERPANGLRLDSYKNVMAGGKNGPVVVPGKPQQSQLVKSITGASQPRMPKNGPPWLTDAEVSTTEKWIASGAAE
jgi:hypothetical protein